MVAVVDGARGDGRRRVVGGAVASVGGGVVSGGGMMTCCTAAALAGFSDPPERVTTMAKAEAATTVASAATRPGFALQPFPALSVGVVVSGSTGRNRKARKGQTGRPSSRVVPSPLSRCPQNFSMERAAEEWST